MTQEIKWIKISDQLPPNGGYVLVYGNATLMPERLFHAREPNIFVAITWNTGNIECAHGDGYVPYNYEDITHWMPLPKEPT